MFAITPYNTNRRLSNRMTRDIDDFFNRLMWASDATGSRTIRDFDLYEEDGKLNLAIEAPGIDPAKLEIKTSSETISIRCKQETTESSDNGETPKSDDKKDENRTWYNKKTACSFNYEISLPFEIDTEKAEATFEHGVIKITAPRLQATESRVLPIKVQ